MDINDLNIYDDLDEFQEKEEKKSAELLALEEKNKELLQTIEEMKKEVKDLRKKVDIMQLNFQILLDTAKTEIKRKDLRIAELQREKDDICFRRRNVRAKETNQSGNEYRPLSAYPPKALEEASTSEAAYGMQKENAEETAAETDPTAEYEHPAYLQEHHFEENASIDTHYNDEFRNEVANTSSAAAIPLPAEQLEEKPTKYFNRQHSPGHHLATATSQIKPDYKPHQTYEQYHNKNASCIFEGEAENVTRPSRDRNRDPRSYRSYNKYRRNYNNIDESNDRAMGYHNHKDASNERYHTRHKWNSDAEDQEGDDIAIGYDKHRDASNNRYGFKHKWNSDAEDRESDDRAIGYYDSHNDATNNRYNRFKHRWNSDAEDPESYDRTMGYDSHRDIRNKRYHIWNSDAEDIESDEKQPRFGNFGGDKDIRGNRYKDHKHRRHSEVEDRKDNEYRSDRSRGRYDRDSSTDQYRRDRSRGRNQTDRSKHQRDSRRYGHSNEYESSKEYAKYSKEVAKHIRSDKHHRKESSSESLKDSYKNYERKDAASKNEKEIQAKHTSEDAHENDESIKKKEEKKEIYLQEKITKSELFGDVQRTTKNKNAESLSSKTKSRKSKSKSKSKSDTSKYDASKSDTSKYDASKSDASKSDLPKSYALKSDASKSDASKSDSPKPDSPKTDSSKSDASSIRITQQDTANVSICDKDAIKQLDINDVMTKDVNLKNEQAKDKLNLPLNVEDTLITISSNPEHENETQECNANNKVDNKAILNTPNKVALFDALFGPSPCIKEKESSQELLGNVKRIINCDSSTSTSPGAYSDDNEKEGTEVMECEARSLEAKANNNNNKDKNKNGGASSIVDVEKYFTATENSKTPDENICDSQEIIKSNNNLGHEVDEKLGKLKDKSKLTEKLRLEQSNNSEVIEIDDDSTADSTDEEIVFERVSSEVVHKVQKSQQPQEFEATILPPEKANENINTNTKAIIEIIEDIRLPSVLPFEQILNTCSEKNTESSEIASVIEIFSDNNVNEDGDEGEQCLESTKLSNESNANGDDVVTDMKSNNEKVLKSTTTTESISMINLDDDANYDENITNELNTLKKIIEFELDDEILLGVDSSKVNTEFRTIAADEENKQLSVDDDKIVSTTQDNYSNEVAEKTTDNITTSVDADDDKQLGKETTLIDKKKSKSRLKKKIHKEDHLQDEKKLEKVDASDDRDKEFQAAAAAENRRSPSKNDFHVDNKISNEKFIDNEILSSNVYEDVAKKAQLEYKTDHINSTEKNQDQVACEMNDDLFNFAVTVKSVENDKIVNEKYATITHNKNVVDVTEKVDDKHENSFEEQVENNTSLENSIPSSVETAPDEMALEEEGKQSNDSLEEKNISKTKSAKLRSNKKDESGLNLKSKERKERKVKEKHASKENSSKENSTRENTTKKEERKKEIKEDARIIIQDTNKESSVKDHERKNAVREKTKKEKQINYNEVEKEEQKQNLPQSKKEIEGKKKVQKKPEKETLLLNKNDTEIIKTSKYSNSKELKTFENVDVINKNKTLHSNEFFVDKIMDNNNTHCEEKKIDDHDKTTSTRKKSEEIKRDTSKVESKSFEYEKHEIEAIIENKSKEYINVDEMAKDLQDILFKNSKNNIVAEKPAETKQFDDPLNPSTSKSLQKTESLEDVKEPRKEKDTQQKEPEVLGKNPKFVEVTSTSRTKKRKLSDEERNGKEIKEIKIKIRKVDYHGSNEKLENLMSEKSQKDSDVNEVRITKRRYERTTAKNREVNETKQVPASSVPTTTRNRNNTRKAKQQTETILRAKDVLQEQLEYVEKPAEKIPEDPEWNVTEALSPEKSPKNVLFECHADKRADHNENDGLTGSAVSERQKTSRLKSQAPAITKTATTNSSSKLKRRNSKSRRTVDHFSSSDEDTGSQTRKTFLNIFRNNAVEAKQAAGQTNLSPPPLSEPKRNKEATKKKVPQVATSNNSIVSAASILGATERSKATIRAPPTPDHAIFHSEPNNPHTNTELPSFSTPQDKKYNDIDSRLQSMFQSPNHATGHLTAAGNIMCSPTHVHEINSESAKVSNTSPTVVVTPPAIVTTSTSPLLSQSLLNDLNVSLTVSETLKDDSILAEQQLNASLLNISNKSEGSCFETKCLSLGNSEYRIEKISANVSKVFIKRKRHKKKNKVD